MAFSHSIDVINSHNTVSLFLHVKCLFPNSSMRIRTEHFVDFQRNADGCNQCFHPPFPRLTLSIICSVKVHNRNHCILIHKQKFLSASIRTFLFSVAQIKNTPLRTIISIWFQPLRYLKKKLQRWRHRLIASLDFVPSLHLPTFRPKDCCNLSAFKILASFQIDIFIHSRLSTNWQCVLR